ncbi:hypothetical protein [Nonomuraea rubra]|uniref:hypothetical protein n=1 Tax=Nonomuraea rubra TaxID=46180 RepID=UPI0033D1E88D
MPRMLGGGPSSPPGKQWRDRSILVTGVAGDIGRRVVDGPVGAGRRVRALTRDCGAARPRDGIATMHGGDFERPGTWQAALDGVERGHLLPLRP